MSSGKEVKKIAKDTYLYTNCIDEEIIIYSANFEGEKKAELVYYYQMSKDEMYLDDVYTSGWTIHKEENKYIINNIGAIQGEYTDICKNPSSALLGLNEYYKRFGYP